MLFNNKIITKKKEKEKSDNLFWLPLEQRTVLPKSARNLLFVLLHVDVGKLTATESGFLALGDGINDNIEA